MSIIEQRISKNKKTFDVHEPGREHFEKFKDKLQQLHPKAKNISKRRIVPIMAKVAAAALILVAVSSVLFNYPAFLQIDVVNGLNGEIAELDQYYTSVSQSKYKEIESIVTGDGELEAMRDRAMHKVERLQDNTEKLKIEYVESNQNEKVYGALVTNYRMLTMALDKVIESMSEIKHRRTTN